VSAPQVAGSKLGITLAVMAAVLMAFLDISIVNVALSDIRASFGTPLDRIGWVSTSYMMSNVVMIPMTGWFQARLGFRRYFVGAIIVFTIASILCGCAWDLPSLIVFRVLQGLGGGAIIPTAQSLLMARYPKQEHSMANALYGLGAVTGPLLGPTIGGYLIDWWSWNWIFLVNLPVGVAAAVLAWRSIEEPGFTPKSTAFDKLGLLLLLIGLPPLQYVLEEGNREGWLESPTIVIASATSLIALVTLIVHELETEHPLIDLKVFRNLTYSAGTTLNFLFGIGLFSSGYVLSLYCGSVLHYAAIDIGRVFFFGGMVQIVAMPTIGRIAPRFDGRLLIATGIIGMSTSFWMNSSLTAESGLWNVSSSQMLRGASVGFIFISLSVLALSNLPAEKRGNAAGLFSLTRELGGSIGTAWMGMILNDEVPRHASHLGESVTPYHQAALDQLAQFHDSFGTQLWDATAGTVALLKLRTMQESLVLAFQECFWCMSAALMSSIVFVFFLRKSGSAGAVEGAH
jgi:DHA2 family multidrug resistance protein